MRALNSSKPKSTALHTNVSDWQQVIKQLAKQAKRQSKVFYRCIKHTLLNPPPPPSPCPRKKLNKFCNAITTKESSVHVCSTPETCPRPPPPRPHSQYLNFGSKLVPHAGGSQGHTAFPHTCLQSCRIRRYIYSAPVSCPLLPCWQHRNSWLVSETFCICKGKGSLRDPDRWRPIAMSNSIYRV